ncbi:MAG: hypothetical protein D6719_07850, partial [Candidatus Dadabacteria bacterium]
FAKPFSDALRAVEHEITNIKTLLFSGSADARAFNSLIKVIDDIEPRSFKPNGPADRAFIELAKDLKNIIKNNLEKPAETLKLIENRLELFKTSYAELTGKPFGKSAEATQVQEKATRIKDEIKEVLKLFKSEKERARAEVTYKRVSDLPVAARKAEVTTALPLQNTLLQSLIKNSVGKPAQVKELVNILTALYNSALIKDSPHLYRALNELTAEVNAALKEHRELSKEAFTAAREKLKHIAKLLPESAKDLKETTRLLQNIEQFVRGQELAQQLSPLMQAMGDPALILFPTVIQGLMSHLKVQVENLNPDGEGGTGGSSTKKRDSERIRLVVTLPAFGKTEVDLFRENKNISLKIYVTDSAFASHIKALLPKLRERFSLRGFTETDIAVSVKKADNVPAGRAFKRPDDAIIA